MTARFCHATNSRQRNAFDQAAGIHVVESLLRVICLDANDTLSYAICAVKLEGAARGTFGYRQIELFPKIDL